MNALQFIQPSPAPSLGAAAQTDPDMPPDFLAIPERLRSAPRGVATGEPKRPPLKSPQQNPKKNGAQVPCGEAKERIPGAVNAADAGPTDGVQAKVQGELQSELQIDLQGGPPAGMPFESGPSHPPYPRQRDARLKRPIAKQSGPVTDEGKAKVSQNAVKHGGYAMPRSGDQSFASIEQSVTSRLEPIGSEQHSLVRSISYEIWRIGSVERTVVALERDIDRERVSLGQLAEQLDFPFGESYREVMLAYTSEESLRLSCTATCAESSAIYWGVRPETPGGLVRTWRAPTQGPPASSRGAARSLPGPTSCRSLRKSSSRSSTR